MPSQLTFTTTPPPPRVAQKTASRCCSLATPLCSHLLSVQSSNHVFFRPAHPKRVCYLYLMPKEAILCPNLRAEPESAVLRSHRWRVISQCWRSHFRAYEAAKRAWMTVKHLTSRSSYGSEVENAGKRAHSFMRTNLMLECSQVSQERQKARGSLHRLSR